METLAIFGVLLILWSLFIRNNLKWTVDKDACNIIEEKKSVLLNKIFFWAALSVGIIMTIIGIIGFFI